jgi:hypothetical protein
VFGVINCVAGTSSRSFYKGILMWREETRILVGFLSHVTFAKFALQ